MIQRLLVLQDRDRRAAQLERERRDIPAHKEEIESRLHEHQETLQKAVEDFKKHELKIREIEGEIEAEDIPLIASAAIDEAFELYGVPKYMEQADAERVVGLLSA